MPTVLQYPTPASCLSGIEYAIASVCLSVCPRSRIEMAGAIDTKLGRPLAGPQRALIVRSEGQGQTLSSLFALAAWTVVDVNTDAESGGMGWRAQVM